MARMIMRRIRSSSSNMETTTIPAVIPAPTHNYTCSYRIHWTHVNNIKQKTQLSQTNPHYASASVAVS